jgi:probable phosphoglycerate mutase
LTGRRLLLLRHGRTAWNESGRAQGHADTELDEAGHRQAAAAASYLASLRPAALWSSDLARARQTCAHLESATGLVAKQDARLREFAFGGREGKTLEEFAETFPSAYESWVRGDEAVLVPGAETTSQVAARIVPALSECLDSLDSGDLGIVVTHGAALNVGLLGVLGWDVDRRRAMHAIDNCAWALLTGSGAVDRVRLLGFNQGVPAGWQPISHR